MAENNNGNNNGKKKRRFSWMLIRIFLNLFLFIGRILPRKALIVLGRGLGRLAYWLFPGERKKTTDHLKIAFPEKSESEISSIARRVFIHIGMNFAELIWLPRMNSQNVDQIVEFDNLKLLQKMSHKNKPVIIVTGHIGNWELMAAAASIKGYPTSVIAKRQNDNRLNETIVRLRRRWEVDTILREDKDSSRKILSIFRKGGFLAILMDQDTKIDSVFVDFFNKKAYTPAGPAVLSLRSDCEVIAAYIHRNGSFNHRITLKHIELPSPTGNKDKDIVKRTQIFTNILEDAIREYPEQWVWMHKRWKTQPVPHNTKGR